MGVVYAHHLALLQVRLESGDSARCGNGPAWMDCGRTLGEHGTVFGLPVGAYAAGYLTLILTVLLAAWKLRVPVRACFQLGWWVALPAVVVALGYLVFASAVLRVLCLHCLGLDLLIGSVFALAWWGAGRGWAGRAWADARGLLRGGGLRKLARRIAVHAGFPLAIFLAVVVVEQHLAWNQPPRVITRQAGTAILGAEQLAGTPRFGSDRPVLRLVEFSDFACPACHRAAATLERFVLRHPGQVEVRFVNYPLSSTCNPDLHSDLHPAACSAARIGIALQGEGRFWDFHRAVMLDLDPRAVDAQHVWDAAANIVGATGLDALQESVAAVRTSAALQRDLALARSCQVTSTPTWVANDVIIEGMLSEDDLEQLLAQADDREHGGGAGK